MLHGLPSYHTLPMPIWGLSRSAHESPVAISMACDAPWLAGWVIREENLFNFFVEMLVAVVISVYLEVIACERSWTGKPCGPPVPSTLATGWSLVYRYTADWKIAI